MSNDMKTVRIPPYIGEEPLVGRYYMAECERCGWLGSSSELTDECQCTREEGGGMCLGHTLEVEPEQLFAIIQAMGKAQADLVKLHGGELGLPKEGWPEYHKRKMETLRDLTAGHYQRKLAERDALLRDTKRSIERNDYPVFELLKRIDATLSASAEPSPLPDPLGCNQCTHVECGKFDGPRQVECRAMADNACARPSIAEPSTPTETLYERGRRIFAEGRGMSCIWGDCKSDDELPEVERGWKAAFDEAVAAGTVPEVKL